MAERETTMQVMPEAKQNESKANWPQDGLSSSEAARRLAQFGPNESKTGTSRSPWADFLLLFTNPLSVILLVAASISATIGQKIDAYMITGLVLMGTGIDFLQTYRSRNVIAHLRATVASLASVKRDGRWQEISRQSVVPGDLIRLSAGDMIPADATIVESRDLYVLQAALTGESAPAEKMPTADSPSRSANAPNMLFLGTSVVSGTAVAVVISTGAATAFSDIAMRLATRPPETAFDAGLRHFGYLITRVVFILVLFVLTMSLSLHRAPLDSLLFAVALAVGLTPEFLPMITSVTLSRGALAMARKHVIVKHLPAIQNLGSIDVLCSDKTGTLTAGKMSLHQSLSPGGLPSDRPLSLARINSELQTGIKSPLDVAILASMPAHESVIHKCDEIPFDFQRRRLSVIAESDGQRMLICKGSPEGILPLVTNIEVSDRCEPISAEVLSNIKRIYAEQSTQGFRVLAIAFCWVPEKASYAVADEAQLTLAGFVSFADPILPETAETVAMLKRDGIEIKILSGDSDLVTAHICREAGIPFTEIVLGEDIDRMSDMALHHVAEKSAVFARLSPAHKLRVLSALRSRGHVVGFIGDGINDAPALHAADVGIAAPTAVDIAQDAADVVLLQPGLKVLHDGIVEGRRAFGNVMKYLLMGTSSNFGNMISMAAASMVLPFLPMLPTQVLLNNFLYDLSQLTIPTDNVDPEYIRSPQHWDIGLIRRFMLFIGPISSAYDFLTFYVLLHVFGAGAVEFHTGWFVESLATQTLVLLVIRTMKRPFKSRPSTGLLSTVIAIVGVGLWLPYSRFAADLGFTPLPLRYFAFLALATLTYLAVVEFAKRRVFPAKPEHRTTGLRATTL